MTNYIIILSSSRKHMGTKLSLPTDFTTSDVQNAFKEASGEDYLFNAIYPYGPYKRVYGTELSIVLKEV